MDVRNARRDELGVVRELEREYTGSDEGLDELAARFDRHPALFVVATDGDELVGEASGLAKPNGTVTLEAIAVKEAYRRRGLGRRLLAAFEANARRYGGLVDVGSAGGDVERFYQACGYRPAQLLVRVRAADLREDYRAAGFSIASERQVGEHRYLYVAAPTYDPRAKGRLQAAFGAVAVNLIFAKELGPADVGRSGTGSSSAAGGDAG